MSTIAISHIDNTIYKSPVKINDRGHCTFDEIAFVNTSELSAAGNYYKKYGVYTKADSVYNKRDYKEFWDREERKRMYGVTLPGKLMHNNKEGYYLQQVHITGEHYGYLNYAPIIRTVSTDEAVLKEALKDIVHARKVGKKDLSFPDFWDGDYYYFHARQKSKELGKHMTVAKARRKGYSYKNAWVAANTYDMFPNRTTVIGAFDMKYLTQGDGTMTMVRKYLDWINTHTAWKKHRLNDSKDFYRSGFKYKGTQEEHGFKSSIIGVSFQDNPDAAIGKDAEEIFFEEAGKFPNLIEALDVTLPTLEDGDLITGLITIFGTGGTKGANWVDFEKVFYAPELFNMLIFSNVWDKNASNTGCGFFHPQRRNMIPYMDAHGNSLINKADEVFNKTKERQKELSKTPGDYLIWCGQRANSPSEAFTKSEENYFYSPGLKEHLDNIKHNDTLKNANRYGEIISTDKGYNFVETDRHKPIVNFPTRTGEDLEGCYVEYHPMFKGADGKPPKDLYRLWHDPYATDKDEDNRSLKDSLGATFVYELPNTFTKTKGDVIVGAYVGRPFKVDDYNENLFSLANYVNGKIQYENDRGEVYPYAKRFKHTDRLALEPEIAWNQEIAGKTGRKFGVSIGKNAQRKPVAAKALKEWLYTVRSKDAYGNDVYNYHYFTDIPTLEELLSWNLKGNFDRVSALLVGMFDLKEQMYNIMYKAEASEYNNDDEFFEREIYI